MNDTLDSIAIVGLGRMGVELSRDFAEKGIKVYGIDIDPRARAAVAAYAEVSDSIATVPREVDAVLELVPEVRELKRQVLTEISARVGEDTRIWMGSSMIPSSSFAGLFSNPHRLMNTHFLPDLHVRRFVELQGSAVNDRVEEEMRVVSAMLRRLDFNVAFVKGESQGYLFNNIWHAIMYTAIRLLDEGVPPETIDKTLCASFPSRYGPCMCMDLIGYRTLKNVFGFIAETNPERPIPALVLKMVEEGKFGLESCQGIYSYASSDLSALHEKADALKADASVKPDECVSSALMLTIMERINALREAGQDTSQLNLAMQPTASRK